jgi:hypothetical protein
MVARTMAADALLKRQKPRASDIAQIGKRRTDDGGKE